MDSAHNLQQPEHLTSRMVNQVSDKMKHWVLWLVVLTACCGSAHAALGSDGRFDLMGPKIDVRVTRGPDTLPIASVPNLQPGDRLWLHPDLPPSQSVKYLLICVFLRGTTNPPPEGWFHRIETWNKRVQQEGTFITVPAEAQQAVLFMAPETGGDFATLKAAVRGRPGVFVRATQDLSEAGFEQARIERYLSDIRRVPSSDTANLQKHSDLLARTLNLKPNPECFKRPVDQQFPCLTQTGSQLLLDDGHAQNIVASLSSGANSDFISQASYTQLAGAGTYSAYVGAVVDLIRIMSNLHTAQYQYIPAIAFPQGEALNLRLNTPPSFRNPKSVLVIGLPSIQDASKPPLQPADPNYIACLLKPSVVLPLEGAPLVFSTDYATEMVLHLNTPPGAPLQADIPLVADAYEGGLRLEQRPEHHVQITDVRQPLDPAHPTSTTEPKSNIPTRGKPVELTGTVQGRWGFDPFTGPTMKLQQLPGSDWHIVGADGANPEVIAGKTAELFVTSTGSACVHAITEQPAGSQEQLPLEFKASRNADHLNRIAVSLPSGHEVSPGSLHLAIQQYGQPQPDTVQTRTFADPAHIAAVQVAAGDRSLLLSGTHLGSVTKLTLGDLTFRPASTSPGADDDTTEGSRRLSLPPDAPAPPTHNGEHLKATVTLEDGRELPVSFTVAPARPSVTLLSRTFEPAANSVVSLSSSQDLPLDSHVDFTLKAGTSFPRNVEVEVETLDGTLRAVLTLAPSGGLILQDPHTVLASLDPLRSFGPSAFGALRVRAVFPSAQNRTRHAEEPQPTPPANAESVTQTEQDPLAQSDWLPLGTLVRLPTLTHLLCPSESASLCSLSGSSLYLLQAISADPGFAQPDRVPDGFTGTTLQVPHPAGSSGTLFLKLRDDPTPIDTATVPTSTAPGTTGTGHMHTAASSSPR